ncbi:unnamed protein product [Diplocarpon coronariae]
MSSLALVAALPLLASPVAAFALNTYDLGLRGLYPRQHFHSVNLEPLQPVITQWDARCDYGNLFFTVRGPSVQGLARGPVITDARGELVWMDNDQFHQAMNLNVQRYRGEDFLTFWTKHDHSKRKKKNGARKKSKKSFVMLPLWPIFWTLLTLASLFGSFCFLAIFWKHARLPDPRLPTIGEVARAFRPRLSALTRVRRRLWGARGGGRWLESEEGSDTEEDPLLLSEREMEMEMGVGKETETDTARGAEGGWRAS